MDMNELVRGIVLQVLSQLEGEVGTKSDKQSFFVVTLKAGERSRAFLENPAMRQRFNMVCAMSRSYDCELAGSGGLAVFGLSNADMARLSSGICDTPFTGLIAKALLMGLPVFAVREEIEILTCDYKTPYAKMLFGKLKSLESMGLTVCSADELEGRALGGAKPPAAQNSGSVTRSGKVITERDVISARDAGARVIKTAQRPIITDLARECAKRHGIEFSAE